MKEPLYGFILDKRHDSKYGDYYVCIHKKGILTKGDKINIDLDQPATHETIRNLRNIFSLV